MADYSFYIGCFIGVLAGGLSYHTFAPLMKFSYTKRNLTYSELPEGANNGNTWSFSISRKKDDENEA